MTYIAHECGRGLQALAIAAGMEQGITLGLFLLSALLLGLYLQERHLRTRDRARYLQRSDTVLGALNAMADLSSRTFDLDEILKGTARCTRQLFHQH